MIRVGVIGAAGRMGATVCNAVAADPGLELVAVVDSGAPGSTTHGLTIASELRALADARVDVAVDFTVAEASRVNLPWLAMHSIHAVVGTTGFTQDDVSNREIIPMPLVPFIMFCHMDETSLPMGVTAPNPVMTTLFFIFIPLFNTWSCRRQRRRSDP